MRHQIELVIRAVMDDKSIGLLEDRIRIMVETCG